MAETTHASRRRQLTKDYEQLQEDSAANRVYMDALVPILMRLMAHVLDMDSPQAPVAPPPPPPESVLAAAPKRAGR